jgi:hypothetical protein
MKFMETSVELEQWLRNESAERIKSANTRKGYARAGQNSSDQDRRIGHLMAETVMGRKLPKTNRKQDAESAKIQECIAIKLEAEATMLLRFADFVRDSSI